MARDRLTASRRTGTRRRAAAGERPRRDEQPHESQDPLQLALEAARMGTWEWEIATGAVRWSANLEAIHGIAPSSFEGTFDAYQKDIHPEDRKRVLAAIATALRRGDHQVEYRIVRPDGGVVWLEARGRTIRDAAGEPLRLIGVCMDVTERKRAEEELKARTAEAQAANRAKSQFLAIISHELRTPLNAIIGYGDLLGGEVVGPLNETQKEHLGRIRRSAYHLLDLINDLLSLARIEAGREEVRSDAADAATVARESATLIEPEAAMQGLGFRIDVPDEPLAMVTDTAKVRQILLNLLSNAVKFTEAGEVGLRVRPGADGFVHFHVQDTGIGIAPEHHETIFEPFTQVDPPNTRRWGGTGLGLPVSRRLARLLGGDLTVESVPGVGSTFTVRLPLDARPRAGGA